MTEKIRTVKKIRFADLPQLFPLPIMVPEKLINQYLGEEDRKYLENWDEAVLVDDIFYVCISRHLKAI